MRTLRDLGITVVCAAHRPAILRYADQVIDLSATAPGAPPYNAPDDRAATARMVG